MNNQPDDKPEDSAPALSAMLEATAAILPWVSTPKALRFTEALNQRWIEAGRRLGESWSNRHSAGLDGFRSAIFALYAVAVDSADADCLHLAEALASAADHLEDQAPARLIAALSATFEYLADAQGLESEKFVERAEHFARRLAESCADPGERSAVIDQLFVQEARERIEQMHDALAVLPPDAYALKTEAEQLAQHAEQLELWGIVDLARRLAADVTIYADDLESDAGRTAVETSLTDLIRAITTVDT